MLPPSNATALLQVLQAKSTEGHARGWSRSGSSERAPYRTWSHATSDEGYGTVSGSCDVHTCGPGAPPLAVSDIGKPTKFGSSRFLYPRLASSATQPVTLPSISRLHRSRLRRSNTSCLGGQLLPPPVRRLQRPACSSPRAAPCIHPRTASAAASKSGLTQRERELLRERVSASLPPPEEGRVDNLFSFFYLDRKRLSLSLGPKRAWRVMDESTSDHTHPPSRQQAAVGGSRASSLLFWLSTEAVAFSPRPHPYLPCFAPLSRERLSLHCSPN